MGANLNGKDQPMALALSQTSQNHSLVMTYALWALHATKKQIRATPQDRDRTETPNHRNIPPIIFKGKGKRGNSRPRDTTRRQQPTILHPTTIKTNGPINWKMAELHHQEPKPSKHKVILMTLSLPQQKA